MKERQRDRITICHPGLCMRCCIRSYQTEHPSGLGSLHLILFQSLCPVSFLSESLERIQGCHRDRDAYSSKEGMWLSWNICKIEENQLIFETVQEHKHEATMKREKESRERAHSDQINNYKVQASVLFNLSVCSPI